MASERSCQQLRTSKQIPGRQNIYTSSVTDCHRATVIMRLPTHTHHQQQGDILHALIMADNWIEQGWPVTLEIYIVKNIDMAQYVIPNINRAQHVNPITNRTQHVTPISNRAQYVTPIIDRAQYVTPIIDRA